MRREGYFWDRLGGRYFPGFSLEEAEPSAELVYETKELHQLISAAIEALPGEQRDAVRLRYYDGPKLAKIAILVACNTEINHTHEI
jgi:DNA-directed RNA polymerase specialized sigma24 family protein